MTALVVDGYTVVAATIAGITIGACEWAKRHNRKKTT